jgi:membrane protein
MPEQEAWWARAMVKISSQLGRVERRIERAVGLLYVWLGRNRLTRFPWAVVQTFSRAEGALLSGSMAYYTFLSLLPLVMLTGFIIATLSVGSEELQLALSQTISRLVPGVQGAEIVQQLIRARNTLGIFGLLTEIYASIGFVGTLTACLNRMWTVSAGRNPVGQKLFNLLVVVLLGAVLLGSVALAWVGHLPQVRRITDTLPLLWLLDRVASPLSLLLVLLLLYRLLPARRLAWGEQLPGALFGALVIEFLKWGFELWTRSSQGVAALPRSLLSVVLLLVWLGLFGQTILYGAALNVVRWRQRRGLPLLPDGSEPGTEARATHDAALPLNDP